MQNIRADKYVDSNFFMLHATSYVNMHYLYVYMQLL